MSHLHITHGRAAYNIVQRPPRGGDNTYRLPPLRCVKRNFYDSPRNATGTKMAEDNAAI